MSVTLFHGSDHIIEKPDLCFAKPTNDYGKGFYCTQLPEMAKEWACKNNTDGYANEYSLEEDGLVTLDLLDGTHTILNWIALLLANRTFSIQNPIERDVKEYIIRNFLIDLNPYDIVIGYRADDSYFSYAQSFISNTLPLKTLARALTLGKLGKQTVLISQKAFDRLSFIKADTANKEIYYPKFYRRDFNARRTWREDLKNNSSYLEDVFAMDIIRERMSNDDPRIQRIVLE